MKSKRIAALVLLVSVVFTGCSELTMGEASKTADATKTTESSTTLPAGTGTGTVVTQPGTTSTTQPVTTKSEDENLVAEWEGKIYPGIIISGFKVGGLTYAEAKDKLTTGKEKVLARTINFTVGTKSYSKSQDKLGVKFDFDAALETAKTVYNDLSVAEKAKIIKDAPENRINIAITPNSETLKAFSLEVYNDTFRKPSIQETGQALIRSEFEKELANRFAVTSKGSESFKAPVKTEAKLPGAAVSSAKTISQSYSWFDEGAYNRSFNVKRGVARVNGTVIQPGEVFSFNETVGSASLKNGFKTATVYSGAGMAEGSGGGICQVSSTLYGAIVKAGLPLVERHTHAYTVGYLPLGLDATIYYPSLDLKFKNTFDYPITIKGSAKDGDLVFKFVTQQDVMKGISYKFSTKVVSEGKEGWTTQYSTKLKPGKESVIYYPHPATSVKVYRSTYLNGKFVKKELFDEVSYRNLNGLRKVGKKAE